MEKTLAQKGHSVTTAADGLEAIDLLAAGTLRPQVIFVDLVMPNIDGAALCRVIRTIPGQVIWVRRHFSPIASPKGYRHLMLAAQGCDGEAFLNGYRIADFEDGEVYLQPGAVAALKEGENVLAFRLKCRATTVDLGLQASPPLVPDLKDILDDI